MIRVGLGADEPIYHPWIYLILQKHFTAGWREKLLSKGDDSALEGIFRSQGSW